MSHCDYVDFDIYHAGWFSFHFLLLLIYYQIFQICINSKLGGQWSYLNFTLSFDLTVTVIKH